jgi:uncharacterized membrane protein YhfC
MNILYITYPFSALLILIISILLGIYLTRRFKLSWHLWLIGAGTFVASQIGHIPFNVVLTDLFARGVLPVPPEQFQLIFNVTVLSLSAGLWEETLRLIAYRWWAKSARSWRKAVLMGAGHGGIEAILFAAVPILATYVAMMTLQGRDLATAFPPDQLSLVEAQVAAYWGIHWTMNLMAVLERIFAITLHISLSVLMLQVFLRRQMRWYFAALFWHAAMNAIILYFAQTINIYAAELMAFLMTITSLGIIFLLRTPEPPEAEEPQGLETTPDPPYPVSLPPMEETPESLERSRYT